MIRRLKGEGSYDYRDNTDQWRWRGYYTTPNGVHKRKEIVAKSRKVLRAKVQKFLDGIENSNTDTINNITLKKWCNIWLNDIIKLSTKPNTYRNYKRTANNHIIPNFGNVRLRDLKPILIQEWLNDLCKTHAAGTVITIRNHFIIILNAAIDYGYIKINPVKRTKPPRKSKKEIVPLTDAEIKKLLYIAAEGSYIYYGAKQKWIEDEGMIYLRKSYFVVILLALTTGMRQGEIFGLKWSSINFSKKTLYVKNNMISIGGMETLDTPKTSTSIRNILLPDKTVHTLRKWKKYQHEYGKKWSGVYSNEKHLVFTNSFGKMVSVTNFLKRYFRKMLRASGIDDSVTFHTLRHTHATQLLKHGVNIKVVSERLGHSSTSVTMDIYAHALPDMQDSAVDKLNNIFNDE